MDTIPTKQDIRKALLKGVIYGLGVAAVVGYQNLDKGTHTLRLSGLALFHEWLSSALVFSPAFLLLGNKLQGFVAWLRAYLVFFAPTVLVLTAVALWPSLKRWVPWTPFLDCYLYAWGVVNVLRWRSWIIGKPVAPVEVVPTARYTFALSVPTKSKAAQTLPAVSPPQPVPLAPAPHIVTVTPPIAPDILLEQRRS